MCSRRGNAGTNVQMCAHMYTGQGPIKSGFPQALLNLSFEAGLFTYQVDQADCPASPRDPPACFRLPSAGITKCVPPHLALRGCARVFWASNLSPQTSHMRQAPTELCPRPQRRLLHPSKVGEGKEVRWVGKLQGMRCPWPRRVLRRCIHSPS